MSTILDCSVNGDRRFHPKFCFIESFGKRDSIENHYQTTKRYTLDGTLLVPEDWRDVIVFKEKGAEFSHFELPNGLHLGYDAKPDSLAVEYYALLWYKFLTRHEHLVNEASKFRIYKSGLENEHPYSHAQIIRDAVAHGLEYLKLKGECLSYVLREYDKYKRSNK